MESKEVVQMIADACDRKHGKEIVVLDMDKLSIVADYFLICHGANARQIQAIARSIKETLEDSGISIKPMEGFQEARWIIVDAGDVLCHIFREDERSYYNLERLWGDATRVPLQIGQEG